jgi:hypothetical protein
MGARPCQESDAKILPMPREQPPLAREHLAILPMPRERWLGALGRIGIGGCLVLGFHPSPCMHARIHAPIHPCIVRALIALTTYAAHGLLGS